MNALLASHSRAADSTSTSSTICRSKVERLITLKYVGGGGLLLQGLAQLVEQPCVLNRDNRLRGEVLDQFALFVGERTDLLAEDGDSTDQLTLLEHRYKEVGSRARAFHEGDEAGVALDVALLRHQIDNVHNAPGCGEAGERVARIIVDDKDRVSTPSLGIGARCVLLGNDTKRVFLI